jgi:uncharacterized protein (DUF2384 family)
MLTRLLSDIRETGYVSPQRVAARLNLSLGDLARMTHVHRNTLARQPSSPAVQRRLDPVVRILAAAEELSGDADQAIVWFRHQPLPGHGGRTARDLVEEGQAEAVLTYLEDLRDGAYA